LAPTDFSISCDGTAFVRQAVWSTWNQTQADGTAVLVLDDCGTNCSLGKLTPYRVSIHLDSPVQTKCGTVWNDNVFTFLTKPPAGATYRNGSPAFVYTVRLNDFGYC
jgi:hypothetical protein